MSTQYLLDLSNTPNLNQRNIVVNERGVILDLVFTSIRNTSVKPAVDIMLQQDRHHPALQIDFEVFSSSESRSGRWKRDLKNCNLDNVLSWIQNIPFPLPNENIEHVFVNFCQRLEEVVVESSPLTFVGNCKFLRWFSKELKQLVVKTNILYRTFKSAQMEERLLKVLRVMKRM